MTDETISIRASKEAQAFILELSNLCSKWARRLPPVEMTASLGYVTGYAMAGVSAHEKLRDAIHLNIEEGRKAASAQMTRDKIAGAVKRASGR